MEEETSKEEHSTQVQEPIWPLSLGGLDYPLRPGEPNCSYYMRTGSCGYGEKCRYNHSRTNFTGSAEYPERLGQSVCQYFMKTGTCKYGASCKYHHPRDGLLSNPVGLNSSGYPLRPEERECSYYMRTSQCKFGPSCKFNHPELTGKSTGAVLTPVQYRSTITSSQPAVASWQLSHPPNLLPTGSYFPGSYGPTLFIPGAFPIPGWSPHPSSISPMMTAEGGQPSFQVGQRGNTFPERPGQPECQYYVRTGSCKFGSACKFHHPRERGASKTNFSLSPFHLPLRLGAPACAFYMQHGHCKFGPACKYDHPMGYPLPTPFLSNVPPASLPSGGISLPSPDPTSLTSSSQGQQQRLDPG